MSADDERLQRDRIGGRLVVEHLAENSGQLADYIPIDGRRGGQVEARSRQSAADGAVAAIGAIGRHLR